MANHTCIIFSSSLICFICFLISSSIETPITNMDFDKYHCSSLCTDRTLKKQLTEVCLTLKYHASFAHRQTDEFIKAHAKCENKSIQLLYADEVEFLYNHDILMCNISTNEVPKCVTLGSQPNKIFVFDYNYGNEACVYSFEQDYTFKSPSWSDRILNFFSCFF